MTFHCIYSEHTDHETINRAIHWLNEHHHHHSANDYHNFCRELYGPTAGYVVNPELEGFHGLKAVMVLQGPKKVIFYRPGDSSQALPNPHAHWECTYREHTADHHISEAIAFLNAHEHNKPNLMRLAHQIYGSHSGVVVGAEVEGFAGLKAVMVLKGPKTVILYNTGH
ncbi:hypothetical protein CAOG_07379 [Capsaspora owczarzaki ATCC 30864]|uniref:Uncharacterized protein n=1 Tax=Capsaspora owczarzaki (strain ATCC 30864) TaxID=595528 RepID=A0A0D2X5B9_CAPO3|nr:hypothetical protein CAOG_07379 [Capsaspora owczarzaki ATCC 30864]KJE97539.1 hypothetical protein CAOG_007379 [Capsaspora owczarzaki ATCC 30864]|eukprot:XP_004343238.1 hypothetical protein CAOG_07379 [Capsaspora owczarzaki ATCC 30864]